MVAHAVLFLDMHGVRQEFAPSGKRSTAPAEVQAMGNGKDLSSLPRISPAQYDKSPLSFGTIQGNLTEPLAVRAPEPLMQNLLTYFIATIRGRINLWNQ